ncbi:hypothetical protein A6D98_19295 [Aliivibrio fischeri]|uniref:hypothetical protein n=1 Tax=Aliivibrio fischeri TaxID=668 RepID=UPI00080E45A7|nr:hypothetical protein [Aliivibrio fischeri]OCH57548.1 hypothetical protein A6D98_19295 [Aliivibrio fischeri]
MTTKESIFPVGSMAYEADISEKANVRNGSSESSYPFPPKTSPYWTSSPSNSVYGRSYDEAVQNYTKKQSELSPPQVTSSDYQAATIDNTVSQTPQFDPNNMYWPPYDFIKGEQIEVKYTEQKNEFAFMSLSEANEFIKNLYDDLGGKDTISSYKDYKKGLIDGIGTARQNAQELGSLGVVAYTKNINGRDWVIIKGYKKHLKTLMRGNKWLANNPRVVELGMGLESLKGSIRYAKFNVTVEVIAAVGINVVEYALNDKATLEELIGNSSGDILKGLATLAIGAVLTPIIIGLAAPFVTATYLTTNVVWVISTFVVGQGLNAIDSNYKLSEQATNEIKKIMESNK